MTAAKVMVRCAATNLAYMRATPAGRAGYCAMARLYQRIASQSLDCARAWGEGRPCPPHEPAVDAFWWGVTAWAPAFMRDVLRVSPIWCALGEKGAAEVSHEVHEKFCRPHAEFAKWLRPQVKGKFSYKPLALGGISPGRLIVLHDASWTTLVVRLTARWGLFHHLKDLTALWQALRLVRRLRRWPDPVARAYLESDLAFLRELFGHFDFSPHMWLALDRFLEAAETEARDG